jgi:hypothetical protein
LILLGRYGRMTRASIPDNWDSGIAGGHNRPHNGGVVTRALENPRIVARRRLVRLLHRDLKLDAFFEAADRALVSVLSYDSSCWLSLDPATLLPTGHFTWQVDGDHLLAMAANEYLEDDVNKFAALAVAPLPVGILSAATGGDLNRSPRYARLLAPYGYRDGDELRASSSTATPSGAALPSIDIRDASPLKRPGWSEISAATSRAASGARSSAPPWTFKANRIRPGSSSSGRARQLRA